MDSLRVDLPEYVIQGSVIVYSYLLLALRDLFHIGLTPSCVGIIPASCFMGKWCHIIMYIIQGTWFELE